jgi:hypothetical protein
MSDEPKTLERKRRRWPSVVPYVILMSLIYMGAYYATVHQKTPVPSRNFRSGCAPTTDWHGEFADSTGEFSEYTLLFISRMDSMD